MLPTKINSRAQNYHKKKNIYIYIEDLLSGCNKPKQIQSANYTELA